MFNDKDIQTQLNIKRLRFYLQATYKKRFVVVHVTPSHLRIEWEGLPTTNEVRQCIDDNGTFDEPQLEAVVHQVLAVFCGIDYDKEVLNAIIYNGSSKIEYVVRFLKHCLMIMQAEMADDCLTLVVSYSGGCEIHEFLLYAEPLPAFTAGLKI